jgi:hypothetical protein
MENALANSYNHNLGFGDVFGVEIEGKSGLSFSASALAVLPSKTSHNFSRTTSKILHISHI